MPHEEPSAWSQHELAGELLRLATRCGKHVLPPSCSRLPQKHLTVLRLKTAAHRRLLTLRPEAPRSLAACRLSRLRLLTFAWRNCFGPRCCDAAPADSLLIAETASSLFSRTFPAHSYFGLKLACEALTRTPAHVHQSLALLFCHRLPRCAVELRIFCIGIH